MPINESSIEVGLAPQVAILSSYLPSGGSMSGVFATSPSDGINFYQTASTGTIVAKYLQ